MNKKTILIVLALVIVVILLGFWWSSQGQTGQQLPEETSPQANIEPTDSTPTTDADVPQGDTTVEIEQQLRGVDLGDLDQEFQDIDAGLQGL